MEKTPDQIFGLVRIDDSVVGIPIHHLSEVCHVDKLKALPVKSDLLMGGFDLRENVIPVVDFPKACGLPSSDSAFKLMVVINHQKRFLAFCIDEVLGIAQTSPDEIQSLQGSDPRTKTHYKGVFAQDGQFISVLNIEAFFALPDVFAITRPQITDVEKHEAKRTPMLVFEAGGALFSVPAVDVYAAVPRQQIKKTAITGGPCLGEIAYYNRRIPVICPIEILGVGAVHKYAQSQIVVLNFPNDKLLGFAVDAVQTIEGFASDQGAKMPVWLNEDCFIKSVTTRKDQRQVFEIDIAALRQSETATTLASLSDAKPNKDNDERQAGPDAKARDIVHEREKYLVVKAGNQLAIPLKEVSYILEPPENITPAPLETAGFKGYFSRFGRSVALFDLCSIMGSPHTDEDLTRILLTGENDSQVAYWVEKVVGIETSEWRETKTDGPTPAAVVKLATKDHQAVLPYLSLGTVVPQINQTIAG